MPQEMAVCSIILCTYLETLAAEINAESRAFVTGLRKTVEHGIRAGQKLAEAKALCAYGEWLTWLEENVEVSVRSAQEFMRLYKHRYAVRVKARDSAHLSVSAALKELAEPKPEPSSLEDHQQQATAHTEAGDRAAFSAAQHYVAGYQWLVYGEDDSPSFAAYLRARHTPVSVIADELVDDAGEPLGVPQMARVLSERMPDLALRGEE